MQHDVCQKFIPGFRSYYSESRSPTPQPWKAWAAQRCTLAKKQLLLLLFIIIIIFFFFLFLLFFFFF